MNQNVYKYVSVGFGVTLLVVLAFVTGKGSQKAPESAPAASAPVAEATAPAADAGAAAADASTSAPVAAAKPAAQQQAGGGQLAALLTSSAWCSFSYNQVSGSSSTERYAFYGNGTFQYSGGGESYSSGYGGTYAGQSSSGSSGQWKASGSTLQVASDDTGWQFVAIPLSISYNSNSSPILSADGTEFSQCN